jgi:hypothetical protein
MWNTVDGIRSFTSRLRRFEAKFANSWRMPTDNLDGD